MARRLVSPVARDFAEVLAFLQARLIVPHRPSEALLRHAKSIHASSYALIFWRFRLHGLPTHGRVFIEEIASDALQILPQLLMGYGKTCKLLIRGLIENSLRHVYFSDHPVEFVRMNRDTKWFISTEQLFDYARNHHEFIKTEKRFDALAQMSSLYSQLSAGIHGRAVRDLEMRSALEKITFNATAAAVETDLLRKASQAISFLLAIFHWEQVRSLPVADRRLILRSMPPLAREVWTEHEVDPKH